MGLFIFHFSLNCYFAAVLGIAGVAKIDSPRFFASSLRTIYKFSPRTSFWLSRVFPWVEIILALMLLMPIHIFQVNVAFINSMLFGIFFLFHLRTYFNHPAEDCGCYGKSLRKMGITTNIISSAIQWILSVMLLLLAIWSNTIVLFTYYVGLILFGGGFIWLLWRTRQRQKQKQRDYANL